MPSPLSGTVPAVKTELACNDARQIQQVAKRGGIPLDAYSATLSTGKGGQLATIRN